MSTSMDRSLLIRHKNVDYQDRGPRWRAARQGQLQDRKGKVLILRLRKYCGRENGLPMHHHWPSVEYLKEIPNGNETSRSNRQRTIRSWRTRSRFKSIACRRFGAPFVGFQVLKITSSALSLARVCDLCLGHRFANHLYVPNSLSPGLETVANVQREVFRGSDCASKNADSGGPILSIFWGPNLWARR
jgi:hypothetical protein